MEEDVVISFLLVQFGEYRGAPQLDEEVLHMGEGEPFWDDGMVEAHQIRRNLDSPIFFHDGNHWVSPF